MFLQWNVICVKVKYVVSCLGWLLSLTWCMYEYVYEMSWLRMIKTLSVVCMNNMRPKMMLWESFMRNLEPSGKVMDVEGTKT